MRSKYLLQGEVDSVLSINDGTENFTSSTSEFSDNMPPATHARKTLVSDFNGDGLKDMFILDHGFDADPFPGSQPKLIIQDSIGVFSWTKLPEVGFHHGGAAGDIDNDGDMDLLVGEYNEGAGGIGSMQYFENTGSSVNPQFASPQENPFGLTPAYIHLVASPDFADLDDDGDMDLLVGVYDENVGDVGSMQYFENTGSATAPSFAAPQQNPFGLVSTYYNAFPAFADLDNDGDMDLLFHFRTRETGISCGDTEATLTGQTWDGTLISGTDSVNTVSCR